MSIKFNPWKLVVFGLLGIFWIFRPGFLGAAAIEVETEDEETAFSPTPTAIKPVSTPAYSIDLKPGGIGLKKELPKKIWPVKSEPTPEDKAILGRKVRIADDIGFNYFMKSGFCVSDESEVPPIGLVGESTEGESDMSLGQKAYVEMAPGAAEVSPGDSLVVYRFKSVSDEAGGGTLTHWAQNLAVVRILEVKGGKCLVQATKCFDFFQKGDFVKPYADEVNRWKGAHVRKSLPSGPVTCRVVDGEPGIKNWVQTDTLVLSAGTKQGVVEGQVFELRGPSEELSETGSAISVLGSVRVFYAGSDYSMAQVLSSQAMIKKDFTAVYKP